MQAVGLSCVIVGGGTVAVRKIKTLLLSGAQLRVISPAVAGKIADWARGGEVQLELREYAGAGDLQGAKLVFAATDSDAVNSAVCRDAASLGLLANDCIKPERGSFVVPASIHRGPLVMTVSTGGASPALAVKLRDELAERYGAEYEDYVEFLAELRARVHDHIAEPHVRRMIFHHLMKFDILELIRSGRLDDYRAKVFAELEREHAEERWERVLAPD